MTHADHPTDDRTDADHRTRDDSIPNAVNRDALERIAARNPTRLGVGRAGPRPRTDDLLTFRADHAVARDAVQSRVDPTLLEELDLLSLQSEVSDGDQYRARPDLGRDLADESLERLQSECRRAPQVQLVVSDGLSSTAVEANVPDLLPMLRDGLERRDIEVGTDVFVEYGRVDVMDAIGEELEAESALILIGERPGLATAESLSAYFVYGPERGTPTARKSVVSNIHDGGVPPVEAGAQLVDLLEEMLEKEASGLDLRTNDRELTPES